jgi:hypothetical protein
MTPMSPIRKAFCIYIDTACDGPVPVIRNKQGFPFVHETLLAAQCEIVEDTMTRLEEFLAGERDYEDAITVEEYVVEVEVFADGSIRDESGRCFGRLT